MSLCKNWNSNPIIFFKNSFFGKLVCTLFSISLYQVLFIFFSSSEFSFIVINLNSTFLMFVIFIINNLSYNYYLNNVNPDYRNVFWYYFLIFFIVFLVVHVYSSFIFKASALASFPTTNDLVMVSISLASSGPDICPTIIILYHSSLLILSVCLLRSCCTTVT